MMPWWIPVVVGLGLFALAAVAVGFVLTHPPNDPYDGPTY